MSQQNILAIIESHLDKMTDLEQRIGHYFLDPNSIQEDLSSLQVAQTLHISQAALTLLKWNPDRFQPTTVAIPTKDKNESGFSDSFSFLV